MTLLSSTKSVPGFKEFPLAIIHIVDQAPINMHAHKDLSELIIVTEGEGVHCTSKGDYPVGAGDVYVIPEGVYHGYKKTSNLCLSNIIFSISKLQIPINDLGELPGFQAFVEPEPGLRKVQHFTNRLTLSTEDLTQISKLVHDLSEELIRKQPGYKFTSIGILIRLLTSISRSCEQGKNSSNESLIRIADVLSWIHSNFSQSINVPSLAEMANMSPSTFNRTFRKAVNHSPAHYILRTRLEHACRLLAASSETIEEIAPDCGFHDAGHLSNQFKKIKGISPSEYRKQNRLKSSGN